jgi:hypothetical protein
MGFGEEGRSKDKESCHETEENFEGLIDSTFQVTCLCAYIFLQNW